MKNSMVHTNLKKVSFVHYSWTNEHELHILNAK